MSATVAAFPAARAFSRAPGLDSTSAPLTRPEPETRWPVLAMPAPAGFAVPAAAALECHLSLDEHLIRNPESTVLLRVQGDALRELGVHDGDLLVIDRATPPTTGSLVVAVVNGQLAPRRLERDGQGRRVLVSAGTAPSDRPPAMGEDLASWGVARWVIHRLWPARES